MSRSFESMVNRTKDDWNDRVHSQYAMAYNTAFQQFKETAGEAAAQEKARAEMFATIVAVMSCSVGVAALGEAWIARLIVRTGLRTLGVANTRAAVRWINSSQKNAVVGFVFGKAFDGLKGVGSDQFQKIATSLFQRVAGGLTETDPLNRHIEMQNLLATQANHLIDMSYQIEANRELGVSQKATATAALHQAPFMQPPSNRLDKAVLAKKIELAFYMMQVLEGDHYVIQTESVRAESISTRRGSGIDMMPSDPKYPKGTITQHYPLRYTGVDVDRPARAFRDKTDALHMELFKKKFFDDGWLDRRMGPDGGRGSHALLLKAERLLGQLSEQTRPKNAMIVAF